MAGRPLVGWFMMLFATGCASHTEESELPIGVSTAYEQSEIEEEPLPDETPAEDVVLEAARSFVGLRTSDGAQLDPETLMTHLAAADAVCVGERHDSPLDHYAELAVIQALVERRPIRGFELGIGLEMVRAKFQRGLSKYAEGRADSDMLAEDVGWSLEWGFPIEYYLPQLEEAQLRRLPMVALGVDRELTAAVAKKGLDGLSHEEMSALPELDASDEKHREVFDQMMAGHPESAHHGPEEHPGSAVSTSEEGAPAEHNAQEPAANLNDYYAAQLVWDESMAARVGKWLVERAPGRKMVILAGAGHCHRSAIPARVERRGELTVVSVLPVDKSSKSDSGVLESQYDYHIVFDEE